LILDVGWPHWEMAPLAVCPLLCSLYNALAFAKRASELAKHCQEQQYNVSCHPSSIEVGDQVLIDTHLLINADMGLTASLYPQQDRPHQMTQISGTTTTIAHPTILN
ncbi:hypothetical protein CHUAL_000021, partial [Chamberlinius hualienensis]